MKLFQSSGPDQGQEEEEHQGPHDLDQQSHPVPLPQGQVLPEEQSDLEQESHLWSQSPFGLISQIMCVLVPSVNEERNSNLVSWPHDRLGSTDRLGTIETS